MNAGTARTSHGLRWALLPVGLLGAMFVGWGLMLSLALDDPGFGVEPDYYEKAVHFDELRALERESERLGWSVELEAVPQGERARVVLTLVDRAGAGIQGARVTAQAFHNAHSGDVRSLDFVALGDGHYEAWLPHPRTGLWEYRVEATRGSDHYRKVFRADLGGSTRER